MSPFTAHAGWALFGSQANRDARFTDKINKGIAAIEDGLLNRASSFDSAAPDALDALFTFTFALGQNSNAITFNQVTGPGEGGAVPGRAIVNWDPSYTNESLGITSNPTILLAHELWHALDGLTMPVSAQRFLQNTSAGPYDNLWEMDAMRFENLVRPVGSTPRTIHNAQNPGSW